MRNLPEITTFVGYIERHGPELFARVVEPGNIKPVDIELVGVEKQNAANSLADIGDALIKCISDFESNATPFEDNMVSIFMDEILSKTELAYYYPVSVVDFNGLRPQFASCIAFAVMRANFKNGQGYGKGATIIDISGPHPEVVLTRLASICTAFRETSHHKHLDERSKKKLVKKDSQLKAISLLKAFSSQTELQPYAQSKEVMIDAAQHGADSAGFNLIPLPLAQAKTMHYVTGHRKSGQACWYFKMENASLQCLNHWLQHAIDFVKTNFLNIHEDLEGLSRASEKKVEKEHPLVELQQSAGVFKTYLTEVQERVGSLDVDKLFLKNLESYLECYEKSARKIEQLHTAGLSLLSFLEKENQSLFDWVGKNVKSGTDALVYNFKLSLALMMQGLREELRYALEYSLEHDWEHNAAVHLSCSETGELTKPQRSAPVLHLRQVSVSETERHPTLEEVFSVTSTPQTSTTSPATRRRSGATVSSPAGKTKR